MEKCVEIVLRGSDSLTLENAKLNNQIIDFNVEFAISNLSKINEYSIILPKLIYNEEIMLNFSECIKELEKYIDEGYNIRIWTSHYDINSYILLLYICNYLKDKLDNIKVIYSDDYDKNMYSIGYMKTEEIKNLLSFEHTLLKEDIRKLSKEWEKIKEKNSELRIIEKGKVKSVAYDYFDNEISKIINKEQTSIISLASRLTNKYYLSETIFIFLIKRLIDINKIRIIKQNEKYVENIIEIK